MVLRTIARVLHDKKMGRNVTIDEKNHRVDSDYKETDGWRTKTTADVRPFNWKECEVTLAVITPKRTAGGWEMRRLLERVI